MVVLLLALPLPLLLWHLRLCVREADEAVKRVRA